MPKPQIWAKDVLIAMENMPSNAQKVLNPKNTLVFSLSTIQFLFKKADRESMFKIRITGRGGVSQLVCRRTNGKNEKN